MKIFVSYSQKIDTWITELIIGLKNKIKKDNLNVEIIWDKTHLKLGNNMHFFMENSIREADKVFIFCDTSYTQKANERSRGVGVETTIITPKMYGNVDQTKFIPIILWNCNVPDYLEGVYGIPIEDKEITENIIDMFYNKIQEMASDKQEKEISFEKINEVKKENQPKTNIGKPKTDIIFKSRSSSNTINPPKKKGNFSLTEDSILNEIFGSTREDWNKEAYRDFFTYKHNILLTIEEKEESEREFFEHWANCYPNKKAYFHEFEIKYNKIRITSIYLISVDGGRAYIPLPNRETNKIKNKYMRFANLIHSYPENINYEYVQSSGLKIDYNDEI